MNFAPTLEPPQEPDGREWWFLFHGDRLLVEDRGEAVAIPRGAVPAERGLCPLRTQYLGTLNGDPCYGGELAEAVEPVGTSFRGLRSLLSVLPDPLFSLAGRAYQIVDWDRTHRYCGKCGGPTEPIEGERARACTGCGMHFFPRVTPAVIVAVVRDRKILLAQSRRFPSAFHSVLAGFKKKSTRGADRPPRMPTLLLQTPWSVSAKVDLGPVGDPGLFFHVPGSLSPCRQNGGTGSVV